MSVRGRIRSNRSCSTEVPSCICTMCIYMYMRDVRIHVHDCVYVYTCMHVLVHVHVDDVLLVCEERCDFGD